MNEDKCFCHFNGYAVKDATARNDIENLKTKTSSLENEVITNKTTISSMNTDVVKNKTDVEVIKQDIETLKTNDNLHTDSINSLNESNSNLDRKMGELATLQTTDKSSIVNAVNSIKKTLDDSDLTNVNQELENIKTNMGSLDTLSTTDKTTLVNAINEIVNQIFTTNWINAQITSDFNLYNDSSYCRYAKIGKLVHIQFALKPSKSNNVLNSGTETTAFVLPEELRPSQNLSVLCQGSDRNIFNVGINTSGNVNIYRYRAGEEYSSTPPGTSAWLPCNICYLLD